MEVKEKEYTVVFCRRETNEKREILLGFKKRGFGVDKWDGFGGKIEDGEPNETAAKRELMEESSIHANELTRVGYLVFNMKFLNKLMKVHVYETWNFSGEAQESEEMRPEWFDETQIPLGQMWPDNNHWLHLVLEGKQFIGRFDYINEQTLEEYSLNLLSPTSEDLAIIEN